jgi:hypothetical protein
MFFIYKLRNNKKDQRYYGSKKINPMEHIRFWLRYWKDHTIYSLGGIRIGYSGIVEGDFRYAVMPQYRGKGYGNEIVHNSLNRLTGKTIKVKRDNYASIRIFITQGFSIKKEVEDWLFMELDC